jgi:hypothetical protein
MSTTHEDFKRQIHSRGPSDRNFGFVFTAAFLFFGLWPLLRHHPMRLWCLVMSGAIVVVTLSRPSWLHIPNRIWTKCGALLGKVVNPIVTGLLFYLVFTPMAVFLRWTGKDPLRLSIDHNAETYWIKRGASADSSDMADQF